MYDENDRRGQALRQARHRAKSITISWVFGNTAYSPYRCTQGMDLIISSENKGDLRGRSDFRDAKYQTTSFVPRALSGIHPKCSIHLPTDGPHAFVGFNHRLGPDFKDAILTAPSHREPYTIGGDSNVFLSIL